MTKRRQLRKVSRRNIPRSLSVNSLTYSGRVGLNSGSAGTTTYWMTPNANYTSAWLGFAPVVGGVFGNNANNLAHTFKQFRIRKLKVEIPAAITPANSQGQIVAYTQQVGYLTTTLAFPTVMEYPCAKYAGNGQQTTCWLDVPSRVLRSTTSPWFSTEDNPGTSSTDPASDPNLSSHGLLIITDGVAASYPYVIHFTLEFRNPESLTQVGPRPLHPSLQLTHDDVEKLKRLVSSQKEDVLMKDVDPHIDLRVASDSLPVLHSDDVIMNS
jgi:hypothetical protein